MGVQCNRVAPARPQVDLDESEKDLRANLEAAATTKEEERAGALRVEELGRAIPR